MAFHLEFLEVSGGLAEPENRVDWSQETLEARLAEEVAAIELEEIEGLAEAALKEADDRLTAARARLDGLELRDREATAGAVVREMPRRREGALALRGNG